MKKFIFSIITSLVCFATIAEEVANMEEESPRDKFVKHTGGFIANKKAAKGSIAIINAQSQVDGEFISKRAEKLEAQLWFNVKYLKVEKKVDFETLSDVIKEGKGTVSVVLVECDKCPSLITIPEMRCALVNVSPLVVDNPDKAKLEKRVAKEITRATAFVLGLGYGNTPGGVLDPIKSVRELDAIFVDMLPGDMAIEADHAAGKLGITRFKRSTYKKACEEGWAPAPKNDIQKAIWDSVHQLPSEPIKIKFEKK